MPSLGKAAGNKRQAGGAYQTTGTRCPIPRLLELERSAPPQAAQRKIRRTQGNGFGNFADDKEYCGAMQNISRQIPKLARQLKNLGLKSKKLVFTRSNFRRCLPLLKSDKTHE